MSDIESDMESMPALIKCDNGVERLDQMRLQHPIEFDGVERLDQMRLHRPYKWMSTKIDKYFQTLRRQALSNTRPWRFSTVASHP